MGEIFEILFSAYCALFAVSVFKEDNSIADIFWGCGFILIAASLFILEGQQSIGHILVLGLITIWGIRLFSLFTLRKLRNNTEDPRYAQWREKWDFFYLRSFLQVYMLQMLLMLLVAVPLFLIFMHSKLDPLFLLFGGIVATIGLIYEVIADWQISTYIKHKKSGENLVYTGGLWKYSRHPNYFGESIFWLGISIISLPISLWGIVGYITITILLLFVSGVPMKEKRQEKKDNWKKYVESTSVFIPWFPKK